MVKNFFNQPVNNDKVTYKNIRKFANGLGDNYTTGCLLDHSYFKQNYEMIMITIVNKKLFIPILVQFNKLPLLQS